MKRLGLAFVLVIALAMPSAAAAKGELEQGSLFLCGPDSCRSIDDPGTLDGLTNTMWSDPATSSDQPAEPAAYYELRFAGAGGDLAAYFVPASRMLDVQPNIRVGVGWVEASGPVAAGLEELARGLAPLPEPTLVRAYLEPGRAADPAPYLALLGPLAKGVYPSATTERVTIDLVTSRPTPWTRNGAHVLLRYAPEERVVLGEDAGWRQVPPELAALIDRDAAVRPIEEPGASPEAVVAPEPASEPAVAAAGNDFPWGLVAALAAGALALISLFAVRRRLGAVVLPLARRAR